MFPVHAVVFYESAVKYFLCYESIYRPAGSSMKLKPKSSPFYEQCTPFDTLNVRIYTLLLIVGYHVHIVYL